MARLFITAAAAAAVVATLASGTSAPTATSVANAASSRSVSASSMSLAAATTRCGSSGPAFTRLAFPRSSPSPSDFPGANDFAEFSATRSGTWAGIEFNAFSRTIYAITWRGGHRPRVLDTFHYADHVTFNVQTSVHMVGLDPWRHAVASVQPTRTQPTGAYRPRMGLWWSGTGRRHYLAHARSWLSWEPVGVTDAGAVVGWAATGSKTMPRYYLVQWDRVNRYPHALAALSYDQPMIAVDGPGHIAYTQANGRLGLRRLNGEVVNIGVPSGGTLSSVAANGTHILASTPGGVYSWDLTHGLPPAVGRSMTGSAGGRAMADSVGPAGDMIVNSPGDAMLRTAKGVRANLPRLGTYSAQYTTAISSHGWAAYTAHSDRRIHFLHCS